MSLGATMQRVTDQVDMDYLKQPPPRPVPFVVVINLLGDHLFEHPWITFLNTILLFSLGALSLLMATQMHSRLWPIPFIFAVGRFSIKILQIWQHVSEDMLLLRIGMITQAHILKMRPHRMLPGTMNGALLDIAIPATLRRTYIGSIWLSNADEAARLAREGRIEVIYLPQAPGTWRVIGDVRTEVRYERTGMTPQPQEESVWSNEPDN